jgi:hypothetical protein
MQAERPGESFWRLALSSSGDVDWSSSTGKNWWPAGSYPLQFLSGFTSFLHCLHSLTATSHAFTHTPAASDTSGERVVLQPRNVGSSEGFISLDTSTLAPSLNSPRTLAPADMVNYGASRGCKACKRRHKKVMLTVIEPEWRLDQRQRLKIPSSAMRRGR